MSNDEKLDVILAKLDAMGSDMQEMKSEIQSIMQKVTDIEQRITDIEQRVVNIEQRVTDIEQRVTGIELKLEEEVGRNIQLLAENHSSLTDKLNQAIKVTDKTLLWEVQLSGFRMRLEKIENEFAEMKKKLA